MGLLRLSDAVRFVVTPGEPSLAGSGVLWIRGGVGVGPAGFFLVLSGRTRRRAVLVS